MRPRQNCAGEFATEELFGYARQELLGYSVEVLIPERFFTGSTFAIGHLSGRSSPAFDG